VRVPAIPAIELGPDGAICHRPWCRWVTCHRLELGLERVAHGKPRFRVRVGTLGGRAGGRSGQSDKPIEPIEPIERARWRGHPGAGIRARRRPVKRAGSPWKVTRWPPGLWYMCSQPRLTHHMAPLLQIKRVIYVHLLYNDYIVANI
jgi:hypothetical protein